MTKVWELYQERPKRALELKEQKGQKIMGYFCCYVPQELLTAVDITPFRIMGDLEFETGVADAYAETDMCPYIRNCFAMGISGKFDFLNGIIFPHSCDNVQRMYDPWKYFVKHEYYRYFQIPHTIRPTSVNFYRTELGFFKETLEKYLGHEIPLDRIKEAVKLHNEYRALLRELYELRKPDPPLVYGSEITAIIRATMGIPVQEANTLLHQVMDELRNRKEGPPKTRARLMISGSELDDVAFMKLVEDCGANIVIDDLCIGTRHFWKDVPETEDPLDGIASHYMLDTMCPRTFRETLDERFSYIYDYAKEWNANGVILFIIKFCESEELDVPQLRDYLRERGYPVLHLEEDYRLAAIGQLKTRVQAFIEMIL